MFLTLAGLLAIARLGQAGDPLQQLLSRDWAVSAPWLLQWLAAGNAITLGLILLLAGLSQVSLRTSARARRGVLVRAVAANVLLACFAFAAAQDSGALDDAISRWYSGVPLLVTFVLAARWGIGSFRAGWKYDARTAEEALAADPRAPVVYLRSFEVDPHVLVTGPSRAAKARALLSYAASSLEQELAFILDRVGPVIAIGKPGEPLPELGAARRYVSDDRWRDVVHTMMREAALVVIRAGETQNLWWEVEQALSICARRRVVIFAFGHADTLPAFERRFTDAFGAPVHRPSPPGSRFSTLLRMVSPYGQHIGRVIYFDELGMPREQPMETRPTWTGFVMVAFRPYRDSLQAAFKEVFADLGLPWDPKRSLTVAVLLALGGGMVGLHQFYMGHTRRGLCYLGFCWTAVPLLLGWIDAVRLARLDDAGFQRRLALSRPSRH